MLRWVFIYQCVLWSLLYCILPVTVSPFCGFFSVEFSCKSFYFFKLCIVSEYHRQLKVSLLKSIYFLEFQTFKSVSSTTLLRTFATTRTDGPSLIINLCLGGTVRVTVGASQTPAARRTAAGTSYEGGFQQMQKLGKINVNLLKSTVQHNICNLPVEGKCYFSR